MIKELMKKVNEIEDKENLISIDECHFYCDMFPTKGWAKKGDKIYIEGRIRTRKWQDDKGMDRYSTEIICRDFTFLSPKDGSSSNPGTSSENAHQEPRQPSNEGSKGQEDTEGPDDLPF